MIDNGLMPRFVLSRALFLASGRRLRLLWDWCLGGPRNTRFHKIRGSLDSGATKHCHIRNHCPNLVTVTPALAFFVQFNSLLTLGYRLADRRDRLDQNRPDHISIAWRSIT